MRWLPYVVPYGLFAALPLLAPALPDGAGPWVDPARIILAAIAMLAFAWRGDYPELASDPPTRRVAPLVAIVAAVVVGLACGFAWVPLSEAVPLMGGRHGFDNEATGFGVRMALRLAGAMAVVPVVEELLVRSFVPRVADASGGGAPWHQRPVGQFSVLSFIASVGFFTISHPEWLAALVTGIAYTLLLMWTHRIRDCIVAHAVSNAVLAIWVITRQEWYWW